MKTKHKYNLIDGYLICTEEEYAHHKPIKVEQDKEQCKCPCQTKENCYCQHLISSPLPVEGWKERFEKLGDSFNWQDWRRCPMCGFEKETINKFISQTLKAERDALALQFCEDSDKRSKEERDDIRNS